MTTLRVIGGVRRNPVLATSYILPSTLTNTQNNQNLSGSRLTPPVVIPATTIVTATTTRIVDIPGFVTIPTPAFFNARQTADVRSAAANTAAAFHLNEQIASDRAALQQKTLADFTIAEMPPQVDDSVVIPP